MYGSNPSCVRPAVGVVLAHETYKGQHIEKAGEAKAWGRYSPHLRRMRKTRTRERGNGAMPEVRRLGGAGRSRDGRVSLV